MKQKKSWARRAGELSLYGGGLAGTAYLASSQMPLTTERIKQATTHLGSDVLSTAGRVGSYATETLGNARTYVTGDQTGADGTASSTKPKSMMSSLAKSIAPYASGWAVNTAGKLIFGS